MSLDTIKDRIPEFAKDIRLNLGTVLSEEGAPGLTAAQRWGAAISVAYSAGNSHFASDLSETAGDLLSPLQVEAAKAAAAIMAMNNVYYRSMHQLEDPEIEKLPAKLRMNIIGKPGIEKIDFELFCLAVSTVNGCSVCVKAHAREAKKASIANEGVQSVIRIAAVTKAAADLLRNV